MTESTKSTRETPIPCESLSVKPSSEKCPCTEDTLAPDDVTRCSTEAIGEFRIGPDYGEPVCVWLCEDHHHAYDELIVETITLV
jgi:hypothetical protein